MKDQNVLVIFAHPAIHRSRVNRALIQNISSVDEVEFVDLYALYPDFHINVPQEQQRLIEFEKIVIQHPFYWYSVPSLLKEWIDLVWEHGFAFGKDATALKGKTVLQVITCGGSMDAYSQQGHNHFSLRELLRPMEQSVRLCGMQYLPPYCVTGTHLLSDAALSQKAVEYRRIIRDFADGRFETLTGSEYLNDLFSAGERTDAS